MTPSVPSSTTEKPRPLAQDQRALFELGLAHVRRIAGKLWSDHNLHDPGITTLELLCYALTDLAYRASAPVADLLARPPGSLASAAPDFHSAAQILPCRPLTEADYRRLLIDLDGVRNAWLEPARQSLFADTIEGRLSLVDSGEVGVIEVPLRGLVDVWLELEEGAREAEVLVVARRLLHRSRNLGQDFERIEPIAEQRYHLCAELELESDADTSRVHADVLFEVAEQLSPRVPRHSLEELLDRGVAVEEIFDGPALEGGFILAEELERAALPRELRLSDVIAAIMRVPGVVAISELVLSPSGASAPPPDPWTLPVPAGHCARLDPGASRLVSFKRGLLASADPARVAARLAARLAQAAPGASGARDLEIPRGQFLDLGRHDSLQNDFPQTYGLSWDGLPSGATEERAVQVRQLQGYLLFFDQLLADYLAQLAHAADLFSSAGPAAPTCFHQFVDSFRDARETYGPGSLQELQAMLDGLDPEAAQLAQRHALLDHLLARFAEDFARYADLLHTTFGVSAQEGIDSKRAFLDDYPRLSSARGLGWDLGERDPARLWDTDNVSGLERRVARLLGMPNSDRRNLSDLSYDLYAEIDSTPDDEFRFRVRRHDTGKIILSASTRYATPEAAQVEMRAAILLAQSQEHYSRLETSDGRFYFNIVDDLQEVIARRIEYFATDELREAAITDLIRYLRGAYSEEGLYLIEDLLLRPRGPEDPLLPICKGAAGCADADPYSYRVHLLLPAFGHRFGQPAFRAYAEQTLREECPAHLLPKICWLDREDMARVEGAYRDWIFLVTGVDDSNRRRKLEDLFAALAEVKNTYPRATLAGCDDERPHFVLSRTALGTQDNA